MSYSNQDLAGMAWMYEKCECDLNIDWSFVCESLPLKTTTES